MSSPLSSGPRAVAARHRDLPRMIAMMALFFLVICAVGILRPIKNALALDGLGETDFYKVYLVSAVVVLFVPIFNRLADRVPWRWLIPGVAAFFALHLFVFRALYVEGSTAFGLIFYGWYDLFAAALVTQFFMATQLFFNARSARLAYPVVISGGSIGATTGGAITGFFAERVGTPNLMIVAGAFIALFAIAMPVVWGRQPAPPPERKRKVRVSRGDLRDLVSNPHVRLIAGMVLITILVKQLVDYQYNTLTKEVFVDLDAISAFQGKFNAATQWLPIVALAALHPMLRRWGVAAAVLALPIAMLLTNVGLLLFWGLWAAVAAKGAETTLRYSAERAGREILYVPVPEDVKLKAKAYIDVAIEKGLGKVASAGLIFVLVSFMEYRQTVWVGLGLAALWLTLALTVRREYVRTLARSIEGRFASLRGLFASLFDATTVPLVRSALSDADPLRVAFALDLVDQAPARDVAPLAPELHRLLDHDSAEIRARALAVLARIPEAADPAAIRRRLLDPDSSVREAAVRALWAARGEAGSRLLDELLGSDHSAIRTATLSCVARGDLGEEATAAARRAYATKQAEGGKPAAEDRVEQALAAGALGDGDSVAMLEPFLEDPDPRVASTALRSAGLLGRPELYPRMIAGLGSHQTRAAARDALVMQGEAAVPLLEQRLLDTSAPRLVRRSIPSVLARIPGQASALALIRAALAPETDQLLDYRAIKALSKLRAHDSDLIVDPELAGRLLQREAAAAAHYATALAAVPAGDGDRVIGLLRTALLEAWRERRETAFRTVGLLHPPDEVYRCYLALLDSHPTRRANALEWLESQIGYTLFHRLDPVLRQDEPAAGASAAGGAAVAASRLREDDDPWIAGLAARVASGSASKTSAGSPAMDTIEKVFLLQQVDLLRDARSGHLAMLASIADEIDAAPDEVLIREGQPTDAMYVVVHGAVELRGMGGTLLASDGSAFGTWALIDQAPSVVEACVTKNSRLLRITRDELHDLIGDHPELAIGLLQGLARRVRTLVA